MMDDRHRHLSSAGKPALAAVPDPSPAVVLAQIRDLAEAMIERAKAQGLPATRWETERDALNWALERLAPELT